MASDRIRAYIRGIMKKPDGTPWDGTPVAWDGRADPMAFPRRSGDDATQEWAKDWHEFGLRVRRDILVLENLLIAKGVISEQDIYGDPGDPPPDPEI